MAQEKNQDLELLEQKVNKALKINRNEIMGLTREELRDVWRDKIKHEKVHYLYGGDTAPVKYLVESDKFLKKKGFGPNEYGEAFERLNYALASFVELKTFNSKEGSFDNTLNALTYETDFLNAVKRRAMKLSNIALQDNYPKTAKYMLGLAKICDNLMQDSSIRTQNQYITKTTITKGDDYSGGYSDHYYEQGGR